MVLSGGVNADERVWSKAAQLYNAHAASAAQGGKYSSSSRYVRTHGGDEQGRKLFLHDTEADPRVGIPIGEETGRSKVHHPSSIHA